MIVFHAGDTSGLFISRGEIVQSTAKHNAQDGSLTRFFGQGNNLNIDIFEANLLDFEYAMLLTDGITSKLKDEEICNSIKSIPAPKGAQNLVHYSFSKGSNDDLTALVLDLIEYE